VPVSLTTTTAAARSLLAGAPSPVVIIAVHNSYDDVVRCVEAVTRHTPEHTALLLVDDCGVDRRIVHLLDRLGDRIAHPLVVLQQPENRGFVRACNAGFAATPGRDVVVLNSDVVVGPEWLERLTAAACSSDTVATASTLTNHGTILSVPDRNRSSHRLPDGLTPDEAARRVGVGGRRTRPSIPTAVGHCMYVRRDVLDLIGPFDDAFSPGYGEEVDFSQRAVAHGFRHVCADDVFTYHRGGGSFGGSPAVQARRADHEAVVRERYPWYADWVRAVESDVTSRLADALATARRSLLGLTVGVDAMCLGPDRMGTQQIVVDTLRALARRPEIAQLVAFVPPLAPAYVDALAAELPAVEFVGLMPDAGPTERLVDLVYRPYQVIRLSELDFLTRVADRVVVNQLDTIAFENPAYFETAGLWQEYRDVTRLTLGLAQGVAFISERSREAARAEGLVDGGAATAVVWCGVDPVDVEGSEDRPACLSPDDEGFLLCIGASYLHKNRRFALEVWADLRHRGWEGRLVLAGPTPPDGNSLAAEAEFLLGEPGLRAEVVTLGTVTEAEKRWLYRRTALVLYPSAIEGFGLVPFEAAHHGVPTLTTRRGSLDEVLPAGIPTLDGFGVPAAADVAWELLHDAVAAKELAEAVQIHGRRFTWDAVAARLLGLFDEALRRPPGRVLAIEGDGGDPIGLAPRAVRTPPPGAGPPSLERMVRAVIDRPGLKQRLSPEGSRRQQVARSVITQARRQLG
jgi:GT2 family glycosyltransferase